MKLLKVKSITKLNKKGKVRNLVVLKNHTFISGNNIVTHNCDALSADAMFAFRNFLEEHHKNCRFIFTANYEHKIIDALKSRLTTIDFSFTHEDLKEMFTPLMKRLIYILKTENVEIESTNNLALFVKENLPDMRHIIKTLQTIALQNNNTIPASIIKSKTMTGDFQEFLNFIRKSTHHDLHKYAFETPIEVVLKTISKNYLEFIKPEKYDELISMINYFDRGMKDCLLSEINTLAFLINFKKVL